jgi:prepilin-type N-terminal cleavage/methylation domain-containing protein
MKRLRSKQSGFTLVEIAIVLVIIGLLLGGVLKGQEMITSSKGKALDNDKSGMQAAFTSYTDRYKAMAGDDPTATARFTAEQCGGAACVSGTGDGLLSGNAATFSTAAAPTNAAENLLAWQHLRAANFLKTGELASWSTPRHVSGGRIGVQAAQIYVGQNAEATGQIYISLDAVPTNVAQSMDSTVDDGFVNRGVYRGAQNPLNAVAGTSYSQGVTGAGAVNVAASNLATYVVAAQLY